MNTFENENLVGPRSDEREERIFDDVNEQGQPLWMAFIDLESPTMSKEEVQNAKNMLAELKNKNPQIIEMCAHKNIDECKDIIREAA